MTTLSLTRTAEDVFAPTTAGGAARGASMAEVQTWGDELEAWAAALALTTGAGAIKGTKAQLDTVAASHAEGDVGLVITDATVANRGIYLLTSGAWVRTADLPASAIAAATSAAEADASATAAAASETNAATSAASADTSEANAASSATLASRWAEEANGVDVNGVGTRSAKHHANQAATSATNAAASASAADTSEANAAASATAADTSEANAATSATNAAASATNAATSETNAATSATNAASSATSAATSATNADTSEANSAASATLASRWAEEADGVDVNGVGTRSAKHWAGAAAASAASVDAANLARKDLANIFAEEQTIERIKFPSLGRNYYMRGDAAADRVSIGRRISTDTADDDLVQFNGDGSIAFLGPVTVDGEGVAKLGTENVFTNAQWIRRNAPRLYLDRLSGSTDNYSGIAVYDAGTYQTGKELWYNYPNARWQVGSQGIVLLDTVNVFTRSQRIDRAFPEWQFYDTGGATVDKRRYGLMADNSGFKLRAYNDAGVLQRNVATFGHDGNVDVFGSITATGNINGGGALLSFADPKLDLYDTSGATADKRRFRWTAVDEYVYLQALTDAGAATRSLITADHDGDVGIGITPASGWKLHVNGKILTEDRIQVSGGAGMPSSGSMAAATGGLGGLELVAEGSGGTAGAAFMAFHRPSAQAVYFGLDTDNKLKVGGWSLGANAYQILDERDLPSEWCFNAYDYGGTADGIADDAAAVDAAIEAAKAAGGGFVILPHGVWRFNSQILIDQSNIMIIGEHGGTRVLPYHSGDTFRFVHPTAGTTLYRVGLQGLYIDETNKTGSGWLVNADHIADAHFSRVDAQSGRNGMRLHNFNTVNVTESRLISYLATRYIKASGGGAADAGRSDVLRLRELTVGGNFLAGMVGLDIDGFVHTTNGHSVHFVNIGEQAMVVQNAIGAPTDPALVSMHDLEVDYPGKEAILLSAGSTYNFTNTLVNGSRERSNIVINDGVKDISFTGGRTTGAAFAGMTIAGDDVRVVGMQAAFNSSDVAPVLGTKNTYPGFLTTATAQDVSFGNCRSGDQATATFQSYGFQFDTGGQRIQATGCNGSHNVGVSIIDGTGAATLAGNI